jgi:hypothetical protein
MNQTPRDTLQRVAPRPKPARNGKLSIPLPFDEAVKAALKVEPSEKPPRKPRAKKSAKP